MIFFKFRQKFPTTSRVFIITISSFDIFLFIQKFVTGTTQNLWSVSGRHWAKMIERRDSWCSSTVSLWYPNENMMCINDVYLKFSTGFLLIILNRIYTNEANFRYDTKRLGTAHWATPFHYLVCAFKLLSGDLSIFCVMPVTNYWTHTKYIWAGNVMTNTPEILSDALTNGTFLYILLFIVDFGHCNLHTNSLQIVLSGCFQTFLHLNFKYAIRIKR